MKIQIGKWIKGWRLDKWFKAIVNGDDKAASELQMTVERVNELILKLRQWLNNPVGAITVIIPGDWDDELKSKAEEFLDKVITNAAKFSECFKEGMSISDMAICVFNKVISLGDEDELNSFWQRLAALGARILSDGKLTWSDAVHAGQFVYDEITKERRKDANVN